MEQKMNSVVITGQGLVGFTQVNKPKLEPHQVMIKVEAAAINPSDILFMRGLYNVRLNLPYTPGWEGSGTVVAIGENI
jgi:NADPH2:quinone reductase